MAAQHAPATPIAGVVVNLGGAPAPPADLTNAVAIAVGDRHYLALRSDGTVTGWGSDQHHPEQPPAGLSNVIAIAAGGDSSTALKSDGSIVGWGLKGSPTGGLSNVIAIASGHDHRLAVRTDETINSWGVISEPPPSSYQTNYVAVAAGWDVSIGLRGDNTAVAWSPGFIFPNPYIFTNTLAIGSGCCGHVVLAVHSDGTVEGLNTTVPAGLSNVVAVSANESGCLALRYDGTVVGWNPAAPSGLSNVLAVAGGSGRGLILVKSLPVITQSPQNQTVSVGDNPSFTVIAGGLPPLSYQWQMDGTNLPGATASSLTVSNVQPTDAGNYNAVVSNSAGSVSSSTATLTIIAAPVINSQPNSQTVFAGAFVRYTVQTSGAMPQYYLWLKNGTNFGAPSDSSLAFTSAQAMDAATYQVIVTNVYGSATSSPATLAITANALVSPNPGTVVGLGVPPIPSDLTNAIAVAAGEHHCLAVRTDGTVAAWGFLQNHAEQPPGGLSNVVAVAAGSTASLALKRDGTVVGWGPKSAPPVDLFGVTAIAAGRDQFLAAKADGTVVSWGLIPSPPPVGASNFLALAAGPGLSAGVLSDGRAVAWGAAFGTPINYVYSSNALGVAVRSFSSFFVLHNNGTVEGINTTVPAGLSNVVAISANSAGSLALRGDGTVFGWDTPVSIALTNIGVVAGGSGFGLLLTTNPPPPVLAGTASPGTFLLSTPISVPGYILESTTGFSLPYAPVDAYTNSGTNTLALPSSSPIRLFRLRKL